MFKYKASLNIFYIALLFLLISNSYLDLYFDKMEKDLFLIKIIISSLLIVLLVYLFTNKLIYKVLLKLNKVKYLFDNTLDAFYVIDVRNEQVLDINKRACIMLGYSREELLNKKVSDFKKPLYSKDKLSWEEQITKLKEAKFFTRRGILTKKDGEEFPVEANISYVKNKKEEYLIAVVRDISSQLEFENRLNYKAYELQRSQELISKSVLFSTSDLDGNITSVSKALEKLSGYNKEELLGKNHNIFKTPDTPSKIYEKMWKVLSKDEQFKGEIKNFTKDRRIYWIKVTIDPIFDKNGKKIGYSSFREDITDKKELEYISSHDALTDICNRSEFMKQLEKKIKSSNKYKSSFGLIMIDIDYFKQVNDTHGHQVGDEVLTLISKCIKSHIRKNDILARWGGEEFVIITEESEIYNLKILVMNLQNIILKTSFKPASQITASFGITIYKENDTELSIQKRVDDALYLAKKNGRNRYEVLL